MNRISINEIANDLTKEFDGLVLDENWGEKAIFYNPGNTLPKGAYLVSFKEFDTKTDCVSNLINAGDFRLNLGLTREDYAIHFGPRPERAPKGSHIEMGIDYSQRDIHMPHPFYAWMCWTIITNPSKGGYESIRPFIARYYEHAKALFRKRIA